MLSTPSRFSMVQPGTCEVGASIPPTVGWLGTPIRWCSGLATSRYATEARSGTMVQCWSEQLQ
jgi:hypothetical protein